jgi:uncharacterized protein YbaR (Trm112 family)
VADSNIIVRGGTSSAANDQKLAMDKAASAARRAYHDKVKATVKQKPNESRLYTRSLGGVDTHASAVLTVLNKDKSVLDYIICDVSFEEHDGSMQPILVMVCPSCLHRRQLGLEKSHITIRSWHRRFTIDQKRRGDLWVMPKPPHEAFRLAGTVNTHERITCPTCTFKFEIDDGVVREV